VTDGQQPAMMAPAMQHEPLQDSGTAHPNMHPEALTCTAPAVTPLQPGAELPSNRQAELESVFWSSW